MEILKHKKVAPNSQLTCMKLCIFLLMAAFESNLSHAEEEGVESSKKSESKSYIGILDKAPPLTGQTANMASSGVEFSSYNERQKIGLRLASDLRTVWDQKKDRGIFSKWAITFEAPLEKGKSSGSLLTVDGLADDFSAKYNFTYTWINISDDDQKKSTKIPLWGIGGEVKVGTKEITFYEAGDLNKNKINKVSYSTTLNFIYSPKTESYGAAYNIGGNYEKSYKEGASKILCKKTDEAMLLDCITGSITEPKQVEKIQLFAEGKWAISMLNKKYVFVSLKAQHDFKNNSTSVDLPVYFITDKKSGLSGGVRATWVRFRQKDTGTMVSDIIIGVFIGKSFSLF